MTEQEKTTQTITSIDQILNIVKSKDITYASQYWVPSLKRDIKFKELNTSQQKRLIKSIIDSPVFSTEFIYTLRDILKENCIDDQINIDSLTVIDKLMLAVGLRINCIGNNISVDIVPKDGEKSVTVNIDLAKIYEIAKNKLIDIEPKILRSKTYIVECSVPTIGTEYNLEKEVHTKVDKIDIETNEQLRTTIGDAFINEVVKYIKKLTLITDDGELPIAWDNFKFVDRIKIVETFDMALLKEVIEYINNIKTEIEKIEIIQFIYNKESYTRRLTIDGNFFTIS